MSRLSAQLLCGFEKSSWPKALFDAVTRQLKAKAVTVKTGTLIDATVIASASHQDGEADWAAHRTRKAVHGFIERHNTRAGTGPGMVQVGRMLTKDIFDIRRAQPPDRGLLRAARGNVRMTSRQPPNDSKKSGRLRENSKLRLQYSPVQSIRHNPARPSLDRAGSTSS